MPDTPRTAPPTAIPVRRRDRAEDDAWIEAFLERTANGILAVPDPDGGAPHVNSNLFVFDRERHALIFHTARLGTLRDRVARDGRVEATFHAYSMGRLLPDVRALEFSVEYEGVTAVGPIAVVDDPVAAEAALQQIMDKYAPHLSPGTDYETATAADLKRTSVYRLDIERWSGKRKEVPADFPGAYRFEDVAIT